MKPFAQLLERLVYTRSRNAKLKLIADYLTATPDPDRGWALAALTGELEFRSVKPGIIKALVEERVDPVLFRMSRSYVGDMAETVSLIWEAPPGAEPEDIRLADAVDRLMRLSRAEAPGVMTSYLDRMGPSERFALIKLATGALRIGVSARLAKTAVAQAFDLDVDDVEEVWHGIDPPYPTLFDWGEGRIPRPTHEDVPIFRPFMLAHPLEDTRVDLADYAAEWKWDGIRVQLNHVAGQTKLFSRTGDDVTGSFPDVAEAFREHGVIDGELLVKGSDQGGQAASFNALQQRLGRKTVSKKMLAEAPAFVRAYDILFDGARGPARSAVDGAAEAAGELRSGPAGGAVRPQPGGRGARLRPPRRNSRERPRGRDRGADAEAEGQRLRRGPQDGAVVQVEARSPAGRLRDDVRAARFRPALVIYSDYTFGCWTGDPADGGELLPVGKAYSGITDEEAAASWTSS